MCRSHGYSRGELLGMTLFDLDPFLSREQWSENWKRIKEQGTLEFETVHRLKRGEIFPVEVSANYVETSPNASRQRRCSGLPSSVWTALETWFTGQLPMAA